MKNKTSTTAIHGIQNYYSSFCKNPSTEDSDSSSEDDLEEYEKSLDVMNEVQFEDIEMDSLSEVSNEDFFEKNTDFLSDQFVSKLAAFINSPLQLQLSSSPPLVSRDQAMTAANELTRSHRKATNHALEPNQTSKSETSANETSVSNDHQIITPCSKTTIDLLENIERALVDRNCAGSATQNCDPERMEVDFPTIQQQSLHWKLNQEQHLAFTLIATALLQHVFVNYASDTRQLTHQAEMVMVKVKELIDNILPPTRQLVFYLGGSGGTGKSRVIKTVVDFARRWNAASSLIISASSGVAATLVGGCTLHSALSIQRNLNPPKPTETQIANWSTIGMLFIDEFSMISASLFDLVDTRLKQLKCRLETPFGGVHMVFCGDFYQIAPVGSTLYKAPSMYGNNPNALATIRGQQLWKTCLTDVIVLEKNLRQSDQAWAESLLRWRTNEPRLEDIRQVNSRVYSAQSTMATIPSNTLAAVSDNRSRENGIRYYQTQLLGTQITTSSDTNWRSNGVLLIRATVTNTNAKEQLTIEEQEYIRNLPAKRLEAAGNLFCILNCDYIINRNEDVSKGVANGTTATLVDVVLKKEDRIEQLPYGGHNVHAVNAEQILSLIFRHKSATWRQSFAFTSLPQGCFPLIPQTIRIKY